MSVGALVAEGAGVRRASGGGGGGRDSAVLLADAPGPGRVTVAVSVAEGVIRRAFCAHISCHRSGGDGTYGVAVFAGKSLSGEGEGSEEGGY